MTDWRGTNTKITPIGNLDGISLWQQNTRMTVDGELQRRYGMAASNVPNAGSNIMTRDKYGCCCVDPASLAAKATT